jgi:hypothetical protein
LLRAISTPLLPGAARGAGTADGHRLAGRRALFLGFAFEPGGDLHLARGVGVRALLALYPLHQLVFAGMLRRIAAAATWKGEARRRRSPRPGL